jgi:hypothetical protein
MGAKLSVANRYLRNPEVREGHETRDSIPIGQKKA